MPFITAGGQAVEYALIPARDAAAPTVILLHEGLGSLALWRDFPARLAEATGAAVLTYSRLGYGSSARLTTKRRVDYMHEEALETLPALREALAIADPILVGHSDGASIALIHAGAGRWPVRGLVLEAPHVFVEDVTITSIEAAREAYATTDLRARLARYHDDVDGAFRGWNDIWLNPEFRAWNIEACLSAITCPTLVLQGGDDEYGTRAQLDAIAAQIGGPVETLLLPDCKHSPHRDQPEAVLWAMTRFVGGLRRTFK
ncbi:MAG TPA: alpha/beta hydrolase [Stellaceae bacterium]|nr:alpha/beta hydrolase [Stellaceae bacterium]